MHRLRADGHYEILRWTQAPEPVTDADALLASGHPRDPAFAHVPWSVLDADGAYLGTIGLPPGFEPRDFGSDWILREWRHERPDAEAGDCAGRGWT